MSSKWQSPYWWSEDEVEYWKTLDHSRCGSYGDDHLKFEHDYERCRGMHCPDCGKSTSSQGHNWPNENGERVCPTPESERKPWPR